MSRYGLSYKPFGQQGILIEWTQIIDKDILYDVLLFKNKIIEEYDGDTIQVTHAYQSILISFNNQPLDLDRELHFLKNLYVQNSGFQKLSTRLWKIPVCYDDKFGVDLHDLSTKKNLTKEEVIALHTEANYLVYLLGFLPGFLYLGGLNEKLYIPRRETPKLKVDKGAVAIGGNQTGIYPNESPGGWHIIGNSPINFFNASQDPPCFAKAGDYIRFYNITVEEYQDIKTLVEAGVYQMESEVLDD